MRKSNPIHGFVPSLDHGLKSPLRIPPKSLQSHGKNVLRDEYAEIARNYPSLLQQFFSSIFFLCHLEGWDTGLFRNIYCNSSNDSYIQNTYFENIERLIFKILLIRGNNELE